MYIFSIQCNIFILIDTLHMAKVSFSKSEITYTCETKNNYYEIMIGI